VLNDANLRDPVMEMQIQQRLGGQQVWSVSRRDYTESGLNLARWIWKQRGDSNGSTGGSPCHSRDRGCSVGSNRSGRLMSLLAYGDFRSMAAIAAGVVCLRVIDFKPIRPFRTRRVTSRIAIGPPRDNFDTSVFITSDIQRRRFERQRPRLADCEESRWTRLEWCPSMVA